ncbi:MAG TPA: glycosyltransferase family 4 protein [Flavobacteriales bacterium]|jgi:glycosyltransferase involved in cell wall biosynthesis|nr:glycosyltransferase family 4 protein [Flavobacteriales bacterium]
MSRPSRILVLYTELAPYVLAGFRASVKAYGTEFHVVRWPVNQEAPFKLEQEPGITFHDRRTFDRNGLLALARTIDPTLVMASGWVDKDYLAVCRYFHARRVPTVMSFDTAWHGGLRQSASAIAGRLWVPFTFSHAWATGEKQVLYARLLGFQPFRIRTGFYTADTAHFLAQGEHLLATRKERWPHRFLCVARYIPTKGQQMLCDAFAALCNEGRAGDWDLVLVGAGDQFDMVRGSTSGAHERIGHIGFKQVHELGPVIEEAGVFVLPSRYEPWGVVVHEQACCGLPLILSDAVGASERFLVEGVNGTSFNAGDTEDLKRALTELIDRNDQELMAMGRSSMAQGRAWSPEAWAGVLDELLRER